MALDPANYPSELDITSPAFNEPVGEADDQIRTAKRALNQGFPNVAGAVTADQDELNTMDGITATTAELNIMDGVTATTAEINKMDGVTATTAELNYTDGVTSAIQAQIDGKAALAGSTSQRFDVQAPNADDQAIRRDTRATSTTSGTIMIRVSGTDAYISTTGTPP
jgi:hypothetical protein